MSLASLNSSGIQTSNPALYQSITDLIKQIDTLQRLVDSYQLLVNNLGLELVLSNPLIINGGQIQFPIVQNPSKNPNTLDDYQEGTWTPIDGSGAGLVFTIPSGVNTCRYTKIGRLVSFSGNCIYPATANGLGAYIGGLPFTVNTIMDGTTFYRYPVFGGTTPPLGFIRINNTVIQLYKLSGTQYTNAELSTTTHYFSGIYEAAN